MSTLPFLLSVADELDNLNSQSYMDDFGLGFHPHRHYYRNPSIQLSLPASTDWLEQKRNRCFKLVKEEVEDAEDAENAKIDEKPFKTENDKKIKIKKEEVLDVDNKDDEKKPNLDNKLFNNFKGNTDFELVSMDSLLVGGGKKDKNDRRKNSHNHVFQKMKQTPRNSNDSGTSNATPNASTTAASPSSSASVSTDDFLYETRSIEFLACFPIKKRKVLKIISASRK